MDGPTDSAAGVATPDPPARSGPAEPVQRWRLTFARDAMPADQVGRAALDAWAATLGDGGLPLAGLEPGGPGRARFALGAPLPATCSGRAELADIWLLERRPAWAVREALEGRMPPGHTFIGAEDVWLGAPALTGQIEAAEWLVSIQDAPAGDVLGMAIAAVLAAPSLPRLRVRASGDRAYDLRPLLADLRWTERPAARGGALRIVTRFDPALGSGRPEEVVAALAEQVGQELPIDAIVRERLVLADPRRDPSPRPVNPVRRGRR